MTLTEFKLTLPLILELSLEVSGKFSDRSLMAHQRSLMAHHKSLMAHHRSLMAHHRSLMAHHRSLHLVEVTPVNVFFTNGL